MINFSKARADSLATGDRYVPAPTGVGTWAVVDGLMEEVVASGMTFENALAYAEDLSRINHVQCLQSLRVSIL